MSRIHGFSLWIQRRHNGWGVMIAVQTATGQGDAFSLKKRSFEDPTEALLDAAKHLHRLSRRLDKKPGGAR